MRREGEGGRARAATPGLNGYQAPMNHPLAFRAPSGYPKRRTQGEGSTMATRQSELQRVLGLLAGELPDPDWVALVDGDGLIVSCGPPGPPISAGRVAARGAA